MISKKISRGQTLLEVVLVLAIGTIMLVSIVSLGTLSVKNTALSRNKTQATKFSQETIEWLRSERDVDWDTFVSHATIPTWCMPTLGWSKNSPCSGNDTISATIFRREARFTTIDANTIEAISVVSWDDSGGYKEVKTSTHFTNWRGSTLSNLPTSAPTPTPTPAPTPAPRQLIEAKSFDSGFREGNRGCCGWSDGCNTHSEDEGCSVTSSYTFTSPSAALSFEVDLLGTLGIRHGTADAHTDLQRLCVDGSCWERGQYICKENGLCCGWHFEETWNRGRIGPFSTSAGRSHTVSYFVQGYCSDWGESFRSKVGGTLYFYNQ